MEKLPAAIGWVWVKYGFALFRRQPLELCTLFLCYMLLMVFISAIPLVGIALSLALMPAFSMAFMQACVEIERGRRVYPTLLLAGFRTPALRTLLVLGVFYLAAALLAVAASRMVDGGVFWQAVTGQLEVDQKVVQQSSMMRAMLFAAVVYTPAAMAFWYAAPLAAWQGMSAGKASFFSFFAVLRATRPFLVYGLAWTLIGVILPAFFGTLLAILTGQLNFARLALLPLSIVLAVIMYCSFYPTYTSIFGRPGAAPQPLPDSPPDSPPSAPPPP